MEENTLILVLGAALLVLAVLIWIFGSRRNEAQAAVSSTGLALEQFSGLKATHPVFYETLRIYAEERSLDELGRDERTFRALSRLRQTTRPVTPRANRSSTFRGLGLEAAHPDARSDYPAMLTVIRAIYSDADFVSSLPEDLQGQTDRLLDSLTQEGAPQL